jgi:hypothetical protein
MLWLYDTLSKIIRWPDFRSTVNVCLGVLSGLLYTKVMSNVSTQIDHTLPWNTVILCILLVELISVYIAGVLAQNNLQRLITPEPSKNPNRRRLAAAILEIELEVFSGMIVSGVLGLIILSKFLSS